MKRFGWIALFMITVNLYGCVTTAVPPKYKLVVSKESKALPPNDFCSLNFALTNTRGSLADPWIEALVLDADNNTIVDRFVSFVASAPGAIYQQETIIYVPCNRIRQVAIAANGEIVEPTTFAWKE
jgi:hypothetical protein